MPKAKLKTEQDTLAMEKRVTAAARKRFRGAFHNVAFEHGQWWVLVDDPDDWERTRTFSVEDQEGGDEIDGFGFEEV